MFTYDDTSHNLLGIAIFIKVTISAWTITRRHFEERYNQYLKLTKKRIETTQLFTGVCKPGTT